MGTSEGVFDLFKVKDASNSFLNKLSVGMLTIITALVLRVKDLTFVASISGAVMVTSLIFIYPTLMF